MRVTREQITDALRDVLDPELGISIVDSMAEWARQAIGRIPGVEEVLVTIVFDPPWTPARIRQDASR